jgi:hypothetical protein
MTSTSSGRPETLTTAPTRTRTGPGFLLRRWPTAAAIGLAGLTAFGLSGGDELAPILAASGLVYLGAAALRKPATAWLVFFGTFVIIAATEVVADVDATWVFLGVAVLFVAYGLLRGAARPTEGLPLQAVAMVAFGAIAAVTLVVNETVGGYLVAAGLLGHAAWDVYHYRANKVVVRSLAEFCFVLDTLLAVAMVIVTARG